MCQVTNELRDTARVMWHELDSNRLRVVLMPSLDDAIAAQGGKIRVAVSRNVEWYREFCAMYQTNRANPRPGWKKPDTMIKRRHTLRALKEIQAGQAKTTYAQRLLPVVKERHKAYMRGEW